MLESKDNIDYMVLYAKAKQTIWHLESKLESISTKYAQEVESLKHELNNPVIKKAIRKRDLMTDLLLAVCRVTNTTAGQVMGPSRDRNAVTARHLFFYIARNEYNISWAKMARLVGRHHTSAMHGAAQYANYINLNYSLETKMYNSVMEAMAKQ